MRVECDFHRTFELCRNSDCPIYFDKAGLTCAVVVLAVVAKQNASHKEE